MTNNLDTWSRVKPIHVKKTFFITEEEAEILRDFHGDNFITHVWPHYELENGKVMFCKYWWPAMWEIFYWLAKNTNA